VDGGGRCARFAFVVNRAVDKEIDARNPRTAAGRFPRAVRAGLWLFSAIVLVGYLFEVWQLAPVARCVAHPAGGVRDLPLHEALHAVVSLLAGSCLGLAPVGLVAVGGRLGIPRRGSRAGRTMDGWVRHHLRHTGRRVRRGTASFDVSGPGCRPPLVQRSHACAHGGAARASGFLAVRRGRGTLSCGLAAALLWYENGIVRAQDLSRVNAAFFTVGVIAVIVFVSALLDRARLGKESWVATSRYPRGLGQRVRSQADRRLVVRAWSRSR
jgi:4-hydroxybenzoate polyprenyltransferase